MKLRHLLEDETGKRQIVVKRKEAADGKLPYYVDNDKLADYDQVTATFLNLTTLEGCPESFVEFNVGNNQITSLVGGPKFISAEMIVSANHLTDLIGAPLICNRDFDCQFNKITHLKGIGKDYLKECGEIIISDEYITGNILGLLLIKNFKHFTGVSDQEQGWLRISRQYWNGTRDNDVLECKEELMNKGYREYARL